MAIEIIDNCKVYVNGHKYIIINSDQISECMRVFEKHKFDGVAMTIYHDYKLPNVDFIKHYPHVKHLSISERISDITGINVLSDLRSAIISGKNRRMDFSFFPKLEVFNADWSPHFQNMDQCARLRVLSLHHYTPKEKNFASISNFTHLKKLKITQSNVFDLHSLCGLKELEEIEFHYCARLEKLCCLDKSVHSLKSLIFDHCKGIKKP